MRSNKNLVFYRGSYPDKTERIKTGSKNWDSYLFVTNTPENARWYGTHIEQITVSPSTKILEEGTADFVKVAGRWRGGENLLEFATRTSDSAKSAGYDIVVYKKQVDVGTAIIDRKVVIDRKDMGEFSENPMWGTIMKQESPNQQHTTQVRYPKRRRTSKSSPMGIGGIR